MDYSRFSERFFNCDEELLLAIAQFDAVAGCHASRRLIGVASLARVAPLPGRGLDGLS